MKKPVKTFRMNGRQWRFVREYLPGDRDGDCDSPNRKNKAVRVHKALKGWKELYTIIHEARHAENYAMYDEEYVVRVCTDLTNLLTRLGYHKP